MNSSFKQQIILFISMPILLSCKVEPVPIIYGSDACHFCKMTIVDQQHAAELVTNKGKAFKYDAIECMMNDLKQYDEADLKYILVTDYESPKKLIDASSAHYLVTQFIPSPMGAYLSGFEDQKVRDWMMKEKEGIAYDWAALKVKFSEKR